MEPQANATIAGKYTLVRKVGASAFAELYLARHTGKDGKIEQVLVRRLLPHLATNDQFVQLFQKVTGVMSALQHPNVLRILEIGDDPSGRFTVTEFVQGQNLRRVQEAARRKGGLHLAHALGIVLDLARGLHYAHEMKDGNGYAIGIVHGDVAPGNVVLGYDGSARIQDFGMVWVEAAVPATDPSLLTEKFPYMSPERVCGAPLDRRSDLFSLALVLYELVTGVPAFQAPTPKELMARIVECKLPKPSAVKEGLAPELEAVLLRGLARVPDERFPTCEAFAKALQEVMEKRNLATSPALLGGYLRGLFGAGAVVEPAAGKKAEPPVKAIEKRPAGPAPADPPVKEPSLEVVRGIPVGKSDPQMRREALRPTPSRPPWSAELEEKKAEITQAKALIAEKQAAAKREADAAAARKAEAEREAARQAEDLIDRREALDRETKQRKEAEAALRNQLEAAVAAAKAAEERADAAGEREAQARQAAEEAAEREAVAKRAAEEAAEREAAAKKAADEAAQQAATAKKNAAEAAAAEALARKSAQEAAKQVDAAKKAAQKEAAARKAAEEAAAREAGARKEAEGAAARLRKELEAAREETKAARKKADETAARMEALSRDLAAKHEADANEREQALRRELDAAADREAAARKEAAAAAEREAALQLALDGAREAEAVAKKSAAEAASRETALQRVYADLLERGENLEKEIETAKADAGRAIDEMRAEMEAKVVAAAEAQQGLEAARKDAREAQRAAEKSASEADVARRELAAAVRESEASKRAAATVRKKWETAEKEKEELRAQLEAARKEADDARKAAEAARRETDTARRQTEAARKLADAATHEAEAAKSVAEAATQEAEAARNEADVHLQEAQAAREEADALRAELDTLRGEMEALRAEAETMREQADAVREAGDAARIEAETLRQEAETIREQAEAARLEAEAARIEALAAAEAAASTESNGDATRIGVSQVALYLSALADAPRTNLRADPGSFIGREEVIHALDLLVKGDEAVLTLVGTDGSGRTRLARRFASTKLVELSQEGGVWYVDLASVRDAEGISHAVASALSIGLVPIMAESETVKHVGAALSGRGRMLLVLDGVDGVADVLRRVLEEWTALAPSARFLLVGRAPVGFEGERTRALAPLGLPTPSSPIESEAMALFVTRARERRRQQGAGAEGGLPVIAKIVKLLEGNPLAIELVAARADVGAPSKLHAEIAKALETADKRAGSMLSRVLEWVWSQLAAPEQDALAQCSLLHGAFTPEAAEEVIDLSAHPSAPAEHEVLRSLRSRGLIGGEDLLLEMHPSVWAFAAAKLEASGHAEAAAARHAHRTLRAGRAAAKELERAGSRDALRRLQLESANLVAVLERALAVAPPTVASAAQALEAVQCLAPAIEASGPFELGMGWLDAALHTAGKLAVDKRLRAEILLARGRLRRARGDVKGSTSDLYDAHDIASVGDDRGFESAVLAEVGLTLQAKGKLEEGRKAIEQALNLARLVKDDRREAQALAHLGTLHEAAGRTVDAQSAWAEAAACFSRCGARRAEGMVFATLGAMLQQKGDVAGARPVLEKALALHQEVRDRVLEGGTVGRLACIALESGELEAGRELFQRAIALEQERGDRRAEAKLRGHLGVLEFLDGRLEEARGHLVKAIWMLGDIGESHLEGLYLAFLAGLVSCVGTLDTGAESFDLAKRQIAAANDAAGLQAFELLYSLFDVAKARQAGDRAAVEAVRSAAARRAAKAPEGSEPEAEYVRLARLVVKEWLTADAAARAASRAAAQGRA